MAPAAAARLISARRWIPAGSGRAEAVLSPAILVSSARKASRLSPGRRQVADAGMDDRTRLRPLTPGPGSGRLWALRHLCRVGDGPRSALLVDLRAPRTPSAWSLHAHSFPRAAVDAGRRLPRRRVR